MNTWILAHEGITALVIGGCALTALIIGIGIIGSIAGCMRSSQISQDRGED